MAKKQDNTEQTNPATEPHNESTPNKSSLSKWAGRLFRQIFSGEILLNNSLKSNYRYFAAMAVMCFVSIVVMFMVLYADMRYAQAEKELRLVQERSIRLQEELYQRTSYDAVHSDLEQRGIIMQDPRSGH
jgi:hypothetical protein